MCSFKRLSGYDVLCTLMLNEVQTRLIDQDQTAPDPQQLAEGKNHSKKTSSSVIFIIKQSLGGWCWHGGNNSI